MNEKKKIGPGRPKVYNEEVVPVQFKLTPLQKRQLAIAAAVNGLSSASLTTQVMEEYLNRNNQYWRETE